MRSRDIPSVVCRLKELSNEVTYYMSHLCRVSSVVDLKKAKGTRATWPAPAEDVVSLIVVWSGMGAHGPVSGQHHVNNIKVRVWGVRACVVS